MKKVYLLINLIAFLSMIFSLELRSDDKSDNELSKPLYVWDVQKTSLSSIDLSISNYGVFPPYRNGQTWDNCLKWPRGTNNSYMFASGFWFGAQKFHSDSGKILNYVSVAYNPNNGRSWFTPGRIEDGLQVDTSSITKHRVYLSSSFNKVTGKAIDTTDGANWPLWNYKSEQSPWLLDNNNYVYDTTKRNYLSKPEGPVFASDEDIFCTYKDTDLSQYDEGSNYRSKMGYPLKLQVDQRILSWNENHPLKDCIIIQYNITNMSCDSLKNCYFGALQEIDIGVNGMKTNWTENDFLRHYEKNSSLNLMIGWTNTDQGEEGKNFGYIGTALIETPTTDNENNIRSDSSFYHPSSQTGLKGARFWLISNDKSKEDERYSLMNSSVFDTLQMPKDYRLLITTGPFNLNPNQTVRIANLITFSLPCKGINADGTDNDLECNDGLIAKVKIAYDYYYTRLLSNVREAKKDISEIEISPNPASEYIEISVSSVILNEVKDLRIFDLLGIELTTPALRDTPHYQGGEIVRLDVSSLSPGVYFLRVGDLVRKFVKI